MFHLSRSLRTISIAGVLAGIATAGRAELSTTSPFLPPQSQVVAPPAPPPPFELRGIDTFGGVTMFSIVDASSPKKSAAWVKLNESGPGYSVKKYDPEKD